MSKAIIDNGPWHTGVTSDGRHYLESDDFTHDVRLYVDGDFAWPGDKLSYAQGIARQLNADSNVAVTWDESMSRILAVTRQDSEGQIISLIAEVPSAVPVSAEPVAWRYKLTKHDPEWTVVSAKPTGKMLEVEPLYVSPFAAQAQPEHCNNGCQGKNCSATEGREHSNECIVEAAESQGWADSPEAEAARLAMAKPDFFTFVINGTHRDISETEPPHDSYDEGSLIPLYKAQQPVSGADGAGITQAAHELKINPEPFQALKSGVKTAEIRNCTDRAFIAGQVVRLREYEGGFYTGAELYRTITHIQRGYGLPEGICVLSYGHSHLPDATKMVPADQFRDAAQMIEPSGNSGELPLPAMRKAFWITEQHGHPDPAKREFQMRFHFKTIEEMDAAHKEWMDFKNSRAALAQQNTCTTCGGVGVVGHSVICPECNVVRQDADKVDAEPDMFWDADDPERCQDSIHDVLVMVQCNRGLSEGDVVEVQRAVLLPNVSVRIAAIENEDGSGELNYEVIDAARKEPAK